MQKNLFFIIILWCLCVVTSCSPIKSRPYTLPNPIFAAFHHQMDLQPLRDTIAKDTSFQIQEIDGGFVLYAQGRGRKSEINRIWINDSLLVYRINSMPYMPMPPNNGIAGSVLLEASFRKTYPGLARNIKNGLTNWTRSNRRTNSDLLYQSNNYQQVVPISIDRKLIQPVTTLTWQSRAFGSQDTYQFQNGVLHGSFQSSKESGLEQNGVFRNGVEFGIWQYKDRLGRLQYIEEYDHHGSLKKVVHQPKYTFSRLKPMPTLKQLQSIHQVMLLVLTLVGVYILFSYFKKLRNFQQPYKGQAWFEILGNVLISALLSFCGGIVILFFSPILANLLGPIISWDLPVDFLVILPIVVFFILVECLILLITNRLWDIFWHVLIMIFGILIYHEWKLLIRLESFL